MQRQGLQSGEGGLKKEMGVLIVILVIFESGYILRFAADLIPNFIIDNF